jgi:DNA (cytosine-5)-methyltransferase 1
MTFGSLFAGIGGLDLGLARAGLVCRWQVEIEPYSRRVLHKRWPDVTCYGDVRTFRDIPRVDLICGGFPCQDLSFAGKRAGIEGDRSGLWFEYARILRDARPRWVLIENVPGLLVHDAMRRVVGELAGIGYVGCWRSVRASDFGASHLRKRVFIVAYRAVADAAHQLHNGTGIAGTDGTVERTCKRRPRLGRRRRRGTGEANGGGKPRQRITTGRRDRLFRPLY